MLVGTCSRPEQDATYAIRHAHLEGRRIGLLPANCKAVQRTPESRAWSRPKRQTGDVSRRGIHPRDDLNLRLPISARAVAVFPGARDGRALRKARDSRPTVLTRLLTPARAAPEAEEPGACAARGRSSASG